MEYDLFIFIAHANPSNVPVLEERTSGMRHF
jgi:hypothetical protein